MIQQESRLRVADDAGAKEITAHPVVLGGSGRRYAGIGDVIVATVRGRIPGGNEGGVGQGGCGPYQEAEARPDGSLHPFDENAAVILKNDGTPTGARLARSAVGCATRPMKIVSLAPEVL
ncbi:uL14 family ribosomal protein [Kocuria rhizophila]|nr:uL14 family ribosomal protein [Kocuria rhizophila]